MYGEGMGVGGEGVWYYRRCHSIKTSYVIPNGGLINRTPLTQVTQSGPTLY